MKLKKPLSECTLEELKEARNFLQVLIKDTSSLIDAINDLDPLEPSDPFFSALDEMGSKSSAFMDLAISNQRSFADNLAIIEEELHQRLVALNP